MKGIERVIKNIVIGVLAMLVLYYRNGANWNPLTKSELVLVIVGEGICIGLIASITELQIEHRMKVKRSR